MRGEEARKFLKLKDDQKLFSCKALGIIEDLSKNFLEKESWALIGATLINDQNA